MITNLTLLPTLSLLLSLISSSSAPINSVQGASSITTGPSGTTYVGYVSSDLSVWIAWRSQPSQSWAYHQLLPSQLNDAHQTVSIAESADGHIHVCAATHNSLLRYWRTTTALDPSTLAEQPNGINTSGSSSNQISYPDLVPAGNVLWLVYRYGTSGVGDTHLAKYHNGVWSDVAVPLIKGRLFLPNTLNDSQYLGNSRGLDNGDLIITWTARVSETLPVNRGVFWEKITPTGDIYHQLALPLTRFTAHNILDDNLSDPTISNSGLSITSLSDNSIHIGFNRYSTQGYREIYYARSDTGISVWTISQISSHRTLNTASTRICEAAPLPCGLEIQGPQLLSTDRDNLALIYTIATTPVNALDTSTWSRLPGEGYIARSSDGGDSWSISRLRQDIANLSGEYPRDTSGNPQILIQSLSTNPGALYLQNLGALIDTPVPVLSVDSSHFDGSRDVSIGRGSISHPGEFSVRLQFSPADDRIMSLAGIEGEWRLTYFGEKGDGGQYGTGGNLQIVSWPPGGSWYVNAGDMLTREIVDIVLVADGAALKVYRDGELIALRSLSSAVSDGASGLWIGGLAGYPQYRFKGGMKIEYYDVALTSDQIELLGEI